MTSSIYYSYQTRKFPITSGLVFPLEWKSKIYLILILLQLKNIHLDASTSTEALVWVRFFKIYWGDRATPPFLYRYDIFPILFNNDWIDTNICICVISSSETSAFSKFISAQTRFWQCMVSVTFIWWPRSAKHHKIGGPTEATLSLIEKPKPMIS